jgi:rSAM/selenodomain-associated transferase 1
MNERGFDPTRRGFCAVAIMAKASSPGMVKTRLVPPLSYEEAARLNSSSIADVASTLAAAARQMPIRSYVAYDPLGTERFFTELLPPDFDLLPPKEATLGRSLHHAAADLFLLGYGMVCLINSDSPNLPPNYLVGAVRRLAEPGDRLILGPAADGGYYLIGLKAFHPRLFEEIAWSTERVFQQTLARANEIGLAVAILPEWYDVDDEASLARLWRDLRRDAEAAPRTARLLAEIVTANPAVRRLFDTVRRPGEGQAKAGTQPCRRYRPSPV